MAGMALPVSPLRRFRNYFTGHQEIEPLPYVKHLDRLAFRSEGKGFSMHAPAPGRGIAELVVKGGYESIDLTSLGYERVLQNTPYRERGIL
jgi:hypothetical protein